MCLDIIYRCPLCKTPSGHKEHRDCDNNSDDCSGLVKIYRWNQSRHYFNWFCANDTCAYSRVSQAVDALEVEEIMKAQAMGRAMPSKSPIPTALTNDSHGRPDKTTTTQASEVAQKATTDAQTPGKSSARSSGQRKPKIWVDLTTLDSDGRPDKPTAPQAKELGKKNQTAGGDPVSKTSTGTTRHRSPKAWVDLTTLDPKVQQEIRELRVKINHLGTARKMVSWWSNDETQLLGLCAKLKLPMNQTATYLPRHDITGCRLRLSVLREKGRELVVEPAVRNSRTPTPAVKKSHSPPA